MRYIAPRGPGHLATQVAIFLAFGAAYALSGVFGRYYAHEAVDNARSLLDLEERLHVDVELRVQHAVMTGPAFLRQVVDETYLLCQFAISNVFLVWAYARHNSRYGRIRDALVAANVVALATLFVMPLAPPRLLPGAGFVDSLDAHAVSLHSSFIDVLNNPYSAMPSLHASYAIAIGVGGFALARHRLVKLVWGLYPLLVIISITATANHFVLDIVAGALALLPTPLVTLAARRLAARRAGIGWPEVGDLRHAPARE